MKSVWLIASVLFLLVGLDLVTKQMALAWVPHIQWHEPYPFGGFPIFSWGISCSLNTAFNTGAAWGIFPGHSGLLFFLRVFIILALFIYLIRKKETRFPLWLIIAGAIGNAVDYCIYGFVVDFIHVTFWGYTFPIFNFADSYITLGALALFLTPRNYADPHLEPKR